MSPDELTISHAQYNQPWTVPYSDGVMEASKESVPHILGTHTVLHAIKSLGKIAAVYEAMDHGSGIGTREQRDIENMSADLVTAALRLANLHRFDLAKVLCERVKEKNGVDILELEVVNKE